MKRSFPIFSRGNKKKKDPQPNDEFELGRTEHFVWRAEAGASSIQGVDWLRRSGVPYLERVYSVYRDEILKLGEANSVPIIVVARPSSGCQGGIAGATGSGELSYCAGEWGPNQFCFGIIAHELVNLFTGEKVSGGWPTAWWANHRSPFPTVIANEGMKKIVPQHYKQWGDYGDPLVVMFDRLYRDFRGMFPKMFQRMREFQINLGRFEEPYLSHVVYYFMFHSAGRQLGDYFVSPPMPPINPRWLYDLEAQFKLGVI